MFSASAQEMIHYAKVADKNYSYIVYKDHATDHFHKIHFYDFKSPTDSVLHKTTEGYFNETTNKIKRSGFEIFYTERGDPKKYKYYNLNKEHGYDLFTQKEYFSGHEIKKIPILAYKYVSKESSLEDEAFRAMAEEEIVPKPSTSDGYDYDVYTNSVIDQSSENYSKPYINWWLNNLLLSHDEKHKVIGGVEFTLDFTPYKNEEKTPIIIMLNNGPKGYYYIQIDYSGTVALGETTPTGDRNCLVVGRITRIKWDEENHLKLQVLDNGIWYIEINDRIFTSQIEDYESELEGKEANNALSSRWGISNRLQISTEMDIQYIGLQQIEIINTEEKTHPYNGIDGDELYFLNNQIIEFLFKNTDEGELKDQQLYLCGFQTDEENISVVKTMSNVNFMNNSTRETTTRPMSINYILDISSNAIKEVKIKFDLKSSITLSAKDLYDKIFKDTDGYTLINGALHHPKSRN